MEQALESRLERKEYSGSLGVCIDGRGCRRSGIAHPRVVGHSEELVQEGILRKALRRRR